MKALTAAASITEARDLAWLIQQQSDAVVIASMQTPDATLLPAGQAKPEPVKLVAV